jgi:hypothetical protein
MTTTAPRRAAQAARPKPSRRPKVPGPKAPNAAYAYDSAGFIGTVVEAGELHFAFDPDGRPLGAFPTRLAAVRVLPGMREADEAAMYVGSFPFTSLNEVLQ